MLHSYSIGGLESRILHPLKSSYGWIRTLLSGAQEKQVMLCH